MRTNLRFVAAIDWRRLPTPGGPTKHRIGMSLSTMLLTPQVFAVTPDRGEVNSHRDSALARSLLMLDFFFRQMTSVSVSVIAPVASADIGDISFQFFSSARGLVGSFR
jgi:hypothetical protein